MTIERATVQDAPEILALQKLAYQSEAALYNDDSIPPLTQTLENLIERFQIEVCLKALLDGQIVGSVRAYEENGTCYIGRLTVHPDCQNRGIGSRLMHEIERHFESVQRYELFTGDRSERNLYLYQKLGYQVFCSRPLNDVVTLVYLEKLPARS
ncbi:MAG: GNAT family N-acetyltransferase [Chloroflexi bacterium]|nr:GNAT family N-acetyltransferase [Chloroflexota bacterium]